MKPPSIRHKKAPIGRRKSGSVVPEKSINGKSCLITGATGGIGRALAFRIAEERCNLLLTARRTEPLKALKREIEQIHGCDAVVRIRKADLARVADLHLLAETALRHFGTVDIFVNNAAIFAVKAITESSARDFDAFFNVNVRAPFMLAKAFVPGMVSKRWGRIVNIGSSSAYTGFPGTSLYNASKHALLGLSRSFHEELKDQNVRSIIVSPGSVNTAMGRRVPDQEIETFIEPSEIADFVAFVLGLDGNMVSNEVRLNRMFSR